MPRLLPDILFPTTAFSIAELSAARLDGELTSVDGGYMPIDSADTIAVRLQALRPLLPESAIVERQSALWAYGFRPFPPARHQACVRAGRGRRAPSSARLQVREVILHDEDITRANGVRITSMLRTAVDLARSLSRIDDVQGAQLVHLLAASGRTLAESLDRLDRCRNMPNKARARERLTELHARVLTRDQPPLTR